MTTVLVAEGVSVDPRAIARIAEGAAMAVAGVVRMEPTLAGLMTGFGHRIGDAVSGREVTVPVDGVEVVPGAGGGVVVEIALSVAGRPARDTVVEVSQRVRAALTLALGVLVTRVEVAAVDVATLPLDGAR